MTARIGLIGYGLGGRVFHAPFIRAAQNLDLVAVQVTNAERAAQARAENPSARIVADLDGVQAAGAEAVVISTPPATHRDLTLEAVRRGLHVVVDKPFALTYADAQEMARAAEEAGVLLTVFHNRRYDTDIRTARALMQSGRLGQVRRFEFALDQGFSAPERVASKGGVLLDLGPHVIDCALHLLGPATSVHAQLQMRPTDQGPTDVAHAIAIEHENGAQSLVSATKASGIVGRRLRLTSDEGCYISDYTDVQADAVQAGHWPEHDRDAWGFEQKARWGTLRLREDAGEPQTREGRAETIPSQKGDVTELYEAFADAITSGGEGPVPVAEALHTMEVLQAARTSAEQVRVVPVGRAAQGEDA
ncbi:Gfo/Idh/MocA family oxidoreductase [Helcobacillus massiliensis]|uniref:Putative dehydrogenase n=1 Tax=Helcobacillus massiliensis TaxID=521392 RepID=A0A839QVW0_9MICO|nr:MULTISPECIES: Gfo/Idh/MocA family oxidoreductase [Helcobacillus]MBB3022141.1 putative dehydrogenase [Helcobacillus massiliensis]MCG7426793.1 Gfo/Idh/MocA family oxidoreductase [Helcobacillus sp. ACRRO]MCT1557333.1 Gfo/Idh/MocA family oxidoreductase [Helcobacillus massiliensis]MCT2037123.1 Gfo/Idh/MocA family oxidoreductase [Helcobacillus massiliensis]MCT2331618.1 Gfo/Idh/MocA family oxidoreductase [Helcobacillus massiliensis]